VVAQVVAGRGTTGRILAVEVGVVLVGLTMAVALADSREEVDEAAAPEAHTTKRSSAFCGKPLATWKI